MVDLTGFFLPISLILGLLVFGLASRWYLEPLLLRLPVTDALTPLLLFHGLRYIGLAFLVPGVTAITLEPAFAFPAALGDLLAALLALTALYALRNGSRLAIPLVWTFNIFGILDLANALYRGTKLNELWELGAAYFIPAVIVPALLVTHYLVFRILLRR